METDMKKLTGAFGFTIFAVFLVPILQQIITEQNLTGIVATVFPYIPTMLAIGVLIGTLKSVF